MRMRFGMTYLVVCALVLLAGCSDINDRVQSHLSRADELLSAGKIRQARAEIDAAIIADPSRSITYQIAIGKYWERGLYSDVIEVSEQFFTLADSSKIKPKLTKEDRVSTYFILAFAYEKLGRLDEAETIYKEILSIIPDNPISLNALGWFYADNGIKLNKALALTKRAVALAPNAGEIVDSLGWAQYKLGRYDEAIKTLRKAAELEPDIAEIRYHLGAAYAKRSKKTEALIELNKARILDPGIQEASKLIATLHK